MVSISNGYGLRPGVRPDRLLCARLEHNNRRVLCGERVVLSLRGAVAGLSGPSVGALQRPRHLSSGHQGEDMATYEEILAMCRELYAKQHLEARRGPGIKTCYIAHAKELLGLPKKPRLSPLPRKHPCPPEKLPLIRQAFIALGMLPPGNGR